MSLLPDPSYDSEPPSFEEQFHYWVAVGPTIPYAGDVQFPAGRVEPACYTEPDPALEGPDESLLVPTQSILRIAESTPDYGYAPLSANELLANKFESGPLAAPSPSKDALRDFDSALEILRALIPRYVVDIDRLESRAELRVYSGYPVHPWQGSFKAPLRAQPELKGEPASAMSNQEFEQPIQTLMSNGGFRLECGGVAYNHALWEPHALDDDALDTGFIGGGKQGPTVLGDACDHPPLSYARSLPLLDRPGVDPARRTRARKRSRTSGAIVVESTDR
ncbi:hypothetical protein DFH09DRAFT_1365653 [Mycena vulgaris]|nr:hypothetical protein DFH09DRAFT_1365653 [Mycena vulgaris]